MAFRILDLAQGTPEWKAARLNYLTASNVPVLFDLSPYKTKLGLFEELVTGAEAPVTPEKQILFDIGHGAEKVGREWLVKKFGHDFDPAVAASIEHPDIMASLDGFAQKENLIAEFKYVGAEKLNQIKIGKLPADHEIQVQAQLLVTGAEKCVYFAIDPKGNAAMLDVFPDLKMQNQIAVEAKKFMDMVRAGEAPEPSDKDTIYIDDPRLKMLADKKAEIEKIEASLKILETDAKKIQDALTKDYKETSRFSGFGVTIQRYFVKGRVDYEMVPNLKSVDLEKFRKQGKFQYRVTLDKAKKAKKESA